MQDCEAFPRVYPRVISSVIVFYTIFALLNWIAYGNNVHTVLTTSLPPTALATSIQLAYSIAILFTFPLQNVPSLDILCNVLLGGDDQTKKRRRRGLHRNVIACLCIVILGVIAHCTMHSMAKVVSLMGTLVGCPIAYVFPPLIHSRLSTGRGDNEITKWRHVGNLLVAGLGVIAMVFCSVITIVT